MWMLLWHWIDLYWQVMPAYNYTELVIHYIDPMIAVGMGGLFFAAVIHALGKVNLVAVKDPNLSAGLAFENQ